MPPQNPLTRIQAVVVGLRGLADGLAGTGIDPINLRYWASELEEIRSELERGSPSSSSAPSPESPRTPRA